MSERNNVVAIAGYVGRTLVIELDPVRATRLDAFEARTGIPIVPYIIDFLDDEIFASSVVASVSGGVSCTEPYSDGPPKPEKSSARSCRAMHDCAARPSEEPAKASGRTKHRKSSRLELAAQYGLLPTSSPATESRLADRSPSSSPKSANGRSDLCGNE